MFRVTARRVDAGWSMGVAELGVVTSRTLAAAERAVVAFVCEQLELEPVDVAVVVQPKLDVALGAAVVDARAAMRVLAEQTVVTAARSREVASRLRDAGVAGVDIAALLGVSEQRVSQLLGKTGRKAASAVG